MEKEKIFMKSAGRRGYSPLARVMTLAVMLLAMAATAWAQEPTKYTVTMAEGTVDKDKWTISPTEAAEGKPITATYSGSRHVKSVTAVVKAAKSPAEVTTAPTATTGDIVAGSETALVSGGAAEGGTMYYKVTTANTKPTSTEGFSATVPTAKTLAAGTYYVWYYVQADDTHTDSEISATAVTVTVKAGTPEYYDKLTKINDSYDDQVYVLKNLGRGRTPYNSSLTAAQAYALATYQAAIDGQAVYVIMSSQNYGYEIHYAVSTDASATEHTADLYDICDPDSPAVRMYYVAQ